MKGHLLRCLDQWIRHFWRALILALEQELCISNTTPKSGIKSSNLGIFRDWVLLLDNPEEIAHCIGKIFPWDGSENPSYVRGFITEQTHHGGNALHWHVESNGSLFRHRRHLNTRISNSVDHLKIITIIITRMRKATY